VTCLAGKMFDVVVDLRSWSRTYLQWDYVYLDASSPCTVFVPENCAHGFLALEDNTVCHYLQEQVWSPEKEQNFYYDDFGIEWPELDIPYILSEKDASAPRSSKVWDS
jgi:dTDP-4-dehydrorhamnose 3,5-epimerase-like enzyme